jgi:hypothetical protein
MTDTVETSPQVYARIGGALYLIIIVIGFCSEFFVRDKLVVSGDVTATAGNITASESLWRISIVCAVPLTLILYVLLRPVNKHLALLAVTTKLRTCCTRLCCAALRRGRVTANPEVMNMAYWT